MTVLKVSWMLTEQERTELNEANRRIFVNRQEIEELKRRIEKLEELIKEKEKK